MVKSASMRDVGAWFEVASGRTRPRGNAVRGKTPACRSSHENVIFVRTNPSRSKQSLRIIPSCEDFSRRTPCRRKKERTLARRSRRSAQMGSENSNSLSALICVICGQFRILLCLCCSAKSPIPPKRAKNRPIQSKHLSINNLHFKMPLCQSASSRLFKAASSLVKANRAIFHYELSAYWFAQRVCPK